MTTQAKLIFKIGFGGAPGHPNDHASKRLKEELERYSDGEIELQIFPSAQLGSEKHMIEAVQAGTLELVATSTGPLGLFDPSFLVFDLPYVFNGPEAAGKVLDGPIGSEVAEKLETMDIAPLAWWENGMRQLSNNRGPVTSPEHLRGLRIRTMENAVHMAYFTKLGATPVPLPIGELFAALKNKIVDAQENPLSMIANNKFYKVQKYLTICDYAYSPTLVLASSKWLDTLPADLKDLIRDTVYKLRLFQRQIGREQCKAYLEQIRSSGLAITVLTEKQKESFKDAAYQLYPSFDDQIGPALIEKVKYQGWNI
ncbi:MAG: DctP family TRAP transporter solute-binding subunit [Negativicutes bacterium]|nr:DctP family TRAP transporter solute-binding subunit [Negativicutes bacterium]